MNAVILAGGFGSRLKPLTDTCPKPMLTLCNAPMLDYTVSHLYNCGIKDIVFTLGYMPQAITDWVEGYSGITANYSVEDIPLGTAGGVKKASGLLDDVFIVVSGDALENVDYEAMIACHFNSGKLVTIAVTEVADPRAFGLIERDLHGTVTAFTEKPQYAIKKGIVNCGIYVIDRRVLNYVPLGAKYDFARDLFPVLLSARQINSYYHYGYWSDIGSPYSYYEANFETANGWKYPLLYNSRRTVSRRTGADKSSVAAYSALVSGRCKNSIIGENAVLTTSADITDCVVMPGVTVSGYHYKEIIGEGFSMPILSPQAPYRQDSAQIYKKFS